MTEQHTHERQLRQERFAEAYASLRALAHRRLGQNRGPLLDTTGLVHDAYVRMANVGQLPVGDEPQFLRYAAQVMRSVIVDSARARLTDRRGGGLAQVTLSPSLVGTQVDGETEILRVHDALEELAKFDARLAQVVELRYFGGLTELEVAQALGVTDRTVRRDWQKARVLLAEALATGDAM